MRPMKILILFSCNIDEPQKATVIGAVPSECGSAILCIREHSSVLALVQHAV